MMMVMMAMIDVFFLARATLYDASRSVPQGKRAVNASRSVAEGKRALAIPVSNDDHLRRPWTSSEASVFSA